MNRVGLFARTGRQRALGPDAALLCSLGGLMAASEALYFVLLRLNAVNGLRPVLTFLGLMAALFTLYGAASLIVGKLGERPRATLFLVIAGAILFRLTLVPAGLPHDAGRAETLAGLRSDIHGESVTYDRFLLFDDDIWRYLWDGHVWAHGVNPYLYSPDSSALDSLEDGEDERLNDARPVWEDIRSNINYAGTRTIYPPGAQAVFRLAHALAPGSVVAMKVLVLGCDLLAVLFLALALEAAGRSASLVVLYAWNPLVIKVFAGSGHVDALMTAALAATAYFLLAGRKIPASVAFALSILAKLTPLVLVPFLLKRVGVRNFGLACGIVLTAYFPFLAAGRLLFDGTWKFARAWEFNAGPYELLRWQLAPWTSHPGEIARFMAAGVIVAGLAWLAWVDDGEDRTFAPLAATALGGTLILSPTVMPWYVTWVLPLAVMGGQRIWLWFSGIVCLAFWVMVDGTLSPGVLWLEYGACALLLFVEMRRVRQSAPGGLISSLFRADDSGAIAAGR